MLVLFLIGSDPLQWVHEWYALLVLTDEWAVVYVVSTRLVQLVRRPLSHDRAVLEVLLRLRGRDHVWSTTALGHSPSRTSDRSLRLLVMRNCDLRCVGFKI